MAGHNISNAVRGHLISRQRPLYLQPKDIDENYQWMQAERSRSVGSSNKGRESRAGHGGVKRQLRESARYRSPNDKFVPETGDQMVSTSVSTNTNDGHHIIHTNASISVRRGPPIGRPINSRDGVEDSKRPKTAEKQEAIRFNAALFDSDQPRTDNDQEIIDLTTIEDNEHGKAYESYTMEHNPLCSDISFDKHIGLQCPFFDVKISMAHGSIALCKTLS
ncbi:hypothetical protein BC939DRAFT_474484 [Gamsiella multidivaricata]|uniref:uncharacterized protein n=1 Tax=Gamsiella multidivaricata TaxID=101098 RepID=UPI00221EDBBB|nr:uncharacterized protein BC939DRAFT_474484 [Gamsiella multidivaricata]KAI7828961.1 hypothetical protein BC939DRAFT_474484 [Gamsiella multidivaricata]